LDFSKASSPSRRILSTRPDGGLSGSR
jgi:hypothetical protein